MENDAIEIVQLSPADWQVYKQIRLEALRDAPQAFGTTYASSIEKPDSYWQMRLGEAALRQTSWLLFARQGAQLVGIIGAFRDENDPQTAWVISVYVTGTARGKGVSRLLMDAILSELTRAGFRKAKLGVNPGQTAALRLYESFGFVKYRVEEQQLMGNGEYCDEFMMEKVLW